MINNKTFRNINLTWWFLAFRYWYKAGSIRAVQQNMRGSRRAITIGTRCIRLWKGYTRIALRMSYYIMFAYFLFEYKFKWRWRWKYRNIAVGLQLCNLDGWGEVQSISQVRYNIGTRSCGLPDDKGVLLPFS